MALPTGILNRSGSDNSVFRPQMPSLLGSKGQQGLVKGDSAKGRHSRDPRRHGPLADIGALAEALRQAKPPVPGASVKECLDWLQVLIIFFSNDSRRVMKCSCDGEVIAGM
jgi:hypothetical protein